MEEACALMWSESVDDWEVLVLCAVQVACEDSTRALIDSVVHQLDSPLYEWTTEL